MDFYGDIVGREKGGRDRWDQSSNCETLIRAVGNRKYVPGAILELDSPEHYTIPQSPFFLICLAVTFQAALLVPFWGITWIMLISYSKLLMFLFHNWKKNNPIFLPWHLRAIVIKPHYLSRLVTFLHLPCVSIKVASPLWNNHHNQGIYLKYIYFLFVNFTSINLEKINKSCCIKK